MYQPKTVYGKPFTLEMCKDCVGEGWHDLVTECYNICVKSNIDIAQVKEKFGTLRFYISHGTDKVFCEIGEICNKSAYICEQCGSPGNLLSVKGWWKTLCSNCYEKTKEKEK